LFDAIEPAIPALETGGADHAGSRGLQSAVPSVRPDQGLAAQGLPADRRRRAGAEPQSGKLFAEVEQSAFSPANVVPGVGFSPDKMLQGACSRMAMRRAIASA
jgi:hypothetical protein